MTEPLTAIGNEVLISREGMRTKAYYDSVGVLTIGVGHTSMAGPPKVTPGMTLSEEQCYDIFATDILKYASTVDKVIVPEMSDHERDAFASICYNIGQGGFSTSTFAKRFNAGDKKGCAEAILWWNKPPEIIARRKAEQQQFLIPYTVALPKARSTDKYTIKQPEDEVEEVDDSEVPIAFPFPGSGLQKWEIMAIQSRLIALGYTMVGPIDGIWGPQTTEAIDTLQKHVGIAADYGRLTAAALADETNRYKP